MQRLKIFNIGHRLLSSKFLVKNTCFSKSLERHGRVEFTRSFQARLLPTPSILSLRYKSDESRTKKDPPATRESEPRIRDVDPSTKGSETSNPSRDGNVAKGAEEGTEKLTLFQRYKKMLKEYWYVLLPVHMATSAVWFGGFYYAATQGLDIVPFLEYINLPEYLISPLRNSSLGHIAVASAIYKLATPARYMVTVGATTFAVRVLTKRGLIRPAPTKQQIKTIIQNKMKKGDKEG